MRVKDFVGKYAIHKDYGRVFVEDAPKRSKVLVNIMVVQRGKGWDEATETYKKYKNLTKWNGDGTRTLSWGYTHRDEYGIKDQVRIETLKLES